MEAEGFTSYDDVRKFLARNDFPVILADDSNYCDVLHGIVETHAYKYHNGNTSSDVTVIRLDYDEDYSPQHDYVSLATRKIKLEARKSINVICDNGTIPRTYLFDDNEYDWL